MPDGLAAQAADPGGDPREQELLWPARQHPDELVLPDVYPTRFPGTWVTIYEDTIPVDQRNALFLEGFSLYRIRLLDDGKAQVVIREDPRPDRDGNPDHAETRERYEAYEHPEKPAGGETDA